MDVAVDPTRQHQLALRIDLLATSVELVPERLNPAIAPITDADSFVTEFARACQDHDLTLLIDVVIGRVATDSAIARLKPEWFRHDNAGTRVDPHDLRRYGDVALARYDDPAIGKQIAAWWIERLARLARAGAAGKDHGSDAVFSHWVVLAGD